MRRLVGQKLSRFHQKVICSRRYLTGHPGRCGTTRLFACNSMMCCVDTICDFTQVLHQAGVAVRSPVTVTRTLTAVAPVQRQRVSSFTNSSIHRYSL